MEGSEETEKMESANRRQRKVFKTADPEELDGKMLLSCYENIIQKKN